MRKLHHRHIKRALQGEDDKRGVFVAIHVAPLIADDRTLGHYRTSITSLCNMHRNICVSFSPRRCRFLATIPCMTSAHSTGQLCLSIPVSRHARAYLHLAPGACLVCCYRPCMADKDSNTYHAAVRQLRPRSQSPRRVLEDRTWVRDSLFSCVT